jgi:hypothetical protein
MKAKKVLIMRNKGLIGKSFPQGFEGLPFTEKDFIND